MGTKTDDEAATEAAEVKPADSAKEQTEPAAPEATEPTAATEATEATEPTAATEAAGPAEADGEAAEDNVWQAPDEADEADKPAPTGVGQGAAAVVSAALGLVSLTGSWYGTVAAARETLIGQLRTASTASVATQIKSIYGDAWQASALYGGLFALVALLVGVAVLVRPAFGVPGRVQQAPWIKSVAWAGVALGVIGLLLAVLKYADIALDLPSAS